MTEKVVKKDYTSTFALFYMADYNSILLEKTTKRNEIYLSRINIAKTIGKKEKLWSLIASVLSGELGLDYDISLNPYVFPNWNFKFIYKKKTICTFNIGVDSLSVRLPLSHTVAKDLILSRNELPQSIRSCVENFNCIHCGKCADESNIEIIDGINLCHLGYSNFMTEDSRIITIALNDKEEIDMIIILVKKIISKL